VILADRLFQPPPAGKVQAARNAALHKLRSHTSLRTNQFEVANVLDGLEEHFRVKCRESLADALRQRLDALQQVPSKWHPDILHLLLELSDQPVQKSRLADLESLAKPVEDAPPALRWEDIAKEDGWAQDPGLWSSIRYSDSSDAEVYPEDEQTESDSESDTLEDGNSDAVLRDLAYHPQDSPLLESVRESQAWRQGAPSDVKAGHSRKTPVPEIQAIRETLFMLQGLPTSMFDTNAQAVSRFQISHLAWETHRALVNSFTEHGRQLDIIREFAYNPNHPAYLHAFQDCLCSRLRAFEAEVIAIEARLARPKNPITTSLMAVKGELDPSLESLAALAQTVAQVRADPKSLPFRYLEVLFDESTMAQSAGQTAVFEFLTKIFLQCFNAFLRPIRLWMDEGRLIPDDVMFFVSETLDEVPPREIWQKRFSLRQSAGGDLYTPHFLQPSAKKIFIAGKNIVVLRQLGKHGALREHQVETEPTLTYETVCPEGSEMAPLPDLFNAAFERWIQSKYRKTSQVLKDVVFQSFHLSAALGALHHVYLMSDGSAASYFCDYLFGSIDSLKRSWSDRYTLTVVAQEAFKDSIDSNGLTVSVRNHGKGVSGEHIRDSVKTGLPGITPAYQLSWPVRIILTDEAMAHYQELFTFLLQIKRSLYALRQIRILDSFWGGQSLQDEALFYSLRNSLLWFTTAIQTYLTTLVLSPSINQMRHDMETADDVDAMMSVHDAALKQIRDESLLGSRVSRIRECILDVLDLGVKLQQAYTAGLTSPPPREEHSPTADEEDISMESGPKKTPEAALSDVKADFDKHLRFICEGLRSVARASSTSQSAKWDMLGDMLQAGIRESRW
jgi:gamma-tubulin complex component 5